MKVAVLDDQGLVVYVQTFKDDVNVGNYITKDMRESGQYIDLKSHQQDVGQGWSYNKKNGTFVPPPSPSNTELKRELSQLRKNRQSMGIRYDDRRVECSSESIAGIKTLLDGMNEGRLPPVVNFKTKGGYINLNKDAVAELFTQCQNHFQNCFDVEAELAIAVNAGTLTTLIQIIEEFEKKVPAIKL